MTTTAESTFRSVPLLDLGAPALTELSRVMKLSLSTEDMLVIQEKYRELGREPTDVELEVIAQTWSEHCKHRIFAAEIEHQSNGETETVDGIFKTYVKAVTDEIMEKKPGFILSAFVDNAGFIRLDDELAVCLKAETHNHPSAIEPYAGANTGLGGVIRDILGAGKGARPVASLDVFCFGPPDTDPTALDGDTIHPVGIMRGVVRGVRDYGNRMGIPTVSGAVCFGEGYIYNPLVFCGTAGVIPISDIPKTSRPGLKLVALGARTGRDGLRGATFSSAVLHTDSHEEDQGAVQIGNPIEEKKVLDCVLHAREEGLIEDITDCGAGGFSSACGEMMEKTGGDVYLERIPLKEPGLVSWEIYLSESQERMVLATTSDNLPRIQELADMYGTEMTVLGECNDEKILRVHHHDDVVCELACDFLHGAPRKKLVSSNNPQSTSEEIEVPGDNLGTDLRAILSDVNVCSREPIIREYDHEVQGNTLLKPLAGAAGDAPQDGAVIGVDGSGGCFAMALSILPQYGEVDAYRMGLSGVDEAVRQLVLVGAHPDQIGLLDNFCMGNPEVPEELGKLVECCRGMARAARAYGAPFISGKDSFYNSYEHDGELRHIPVTFLCSGIGIVDLAQSIVGSSIRKADSDLWLMGETRPELGGSALARRHGLDGINAPDLDPETAFACYHTYHQAVQKGWIHSAHDCSEGGLAVALAEMGFSLQAGLEISLDGLDLPPAQALFSESNARFVIESAPGHAKALQSLFGDLPFVRIGCCSAEHLQLRITQNGTTMLDESLTELKALWKQGLSQYY